MKKPSKEKLILDAALKLFNQKGYEKSTMADVAKAAGISKGLTYFYYKNKEDLYMAITKKAFDALEAEFKAIDKMTGKKGLELITELLNRYIDFAEKNRMFYAAILNFMDLMRFYQDEEKRTEHINPLILQSDHFIKLLNSHHNCGKIGIRWISLGIKDGSIRPEVQPDISFYVIWSMLVGFDKLTGPVSYEGKGIKLHIDNWRPGFIRLVQDMLKGTLQSRKVQVVQGTLF
ncbi:MAG: TetR/AcrR family transcriptional regulator [Nitritalea sp.]